MATKTITVSIEGDGGRAAVSFPADQWRRWPPLTRILEIHKAAPAATLGRCFDVVGETGSDA